VEQSLSWNANESFTTQKLQTRKIFMPQRDTNTQSQQASSCTPAL